MSYDRCVCAELPLTHEFLGMMLGTRRAGVTQAAVILQAEGLIKYKRASISITDKQGLEEYACECYGIVKAEFERLPG
jgi:CRP-like cAMP-binding protein